MPLRVLLLVRLLAFMAVIYLLLHMLVARLSRKPESKLLWFFETVTAPLLAAARPFVAPNDPPARRRAVALAVFAAVWAVAILLVESLAPGRGGPTVSPGG